MRDKQEIASAKARAVAVEQANLQELRSRDAKSRAQYSAGHLGNMAGYASNPALAESEKRFAQLTQGTDCGGQGRRESATRYARTRAASVATVRDATAAKIANTAATRTNAAATGLLARSMNTCKTAAKGLWAAMAANPLTVVLAIVGARIRRNYDTLRRMKRASRLAAEMAAETADAATQEREKFEGETPERKKQAERLSQLAEKQQLTNAEQLEAMTILRSLTGVYGDFGVTLDETTGKLIAQSDAFRRLQEPGRRNFGNRKKTRILRLSKFGLPNWKSNMGKNSTRNCRGERMPVFWKNWSSRPRWPSVTVSEIPASCRIFPTSN